MTTAHSDSQLAIAESLAELKKRAPEELKAVKTLPELRDWYRKYLEPERGEVARLYSRLETLPPADQLPILPLLNAAKENLGWDLAFRRQDIWWEDPISALNWIGEQAKDALATIASTEALEEWRTRYLGRERGELSAILKGLGKLPGEQRKAVGQAANAVKAELEHALEARGEDLRMSERAAALERERLDVTLPGRTIPRGHIHPLTQTARDVVRVMSQMGFQLYDGPEVETDYYNFQALNIPPDHPSRDMQDTFWIVPGQVLLRTQTSPMQIRVMERMDPPVRAVVIGKTYRNEATDASHEAVFHQVEGLLIDQYCTMADLRGVVERFAREMFGADRKVRFRPSYFPFTEPSAEFDMDCMTCKGAGCRVCKYSGWLEMGGSGMVDPRVLRGVGYDPGVYRGFAFGLGLERIAMLRHGIDDMRLFQGNDLRFLRQFT